MTADITSARGAHAVVGIDLGGTAIKAGVVQPDGTLSARLERPTPPARDTDTVVAAMVEVVDALRAEANGAVGAVGVAVPGIIDEARGVAVMAANLGWRDAPVRALLADKTGLPVALGHDVRSACAAEWRLGAARGRSEVVLVTLGTGIGAGVVSDGRLLVGGGYAGQLGHVVVEPGGAPCGCGQRGCLATVASASALARRYRVASGAESAGVDAGRPDRAEEVARRARSGDPVAMSVWDEAVSALAAALATVVTVFGPEIVVLGGGLARAGDQLLVPVRDALLTRLTFQRRPEVVPAALGTDAGILGAALLARGVRA